MGYRVGQWAARCYRDLLYWIGFVGVRGCMSNTERHKDMITLTLVLILKLTLTLTVIISLILLT